MGDILSGLGTMGGDLLSGIGSVGNELFQGAQSFLGSLGSDIGGLFGGGSPIGPGTVGGDAASLALPASAAAPANIGQAIGAAGAPMAAGSAAAFDAAPGLAATQALAPAVGSVAANAVPMATDTGGLVPGIDANPSIVPGSGGSSFLTKLLSNPKLLGEGGLALTELLNANKQPPGLDALKALSAQQSGLAKNQGELALGESQGLLPAGAQGFYQSVLDANEAAIRAKYANTPGTSAEVEDLNNARIAIMGQMFQQGQQMAAQGFTNVNQATGYASTLLQSIMDAEIKQGSELGDALAAFAGASAK